MCVCRTTGRLLAVDARILTRSFSTLSIKAGVSRLNSELTNLASLPSQLTQGTVSLCLLCTAITGGTQWPRSIYIQCHTANALSTHSSPVPGLILTLNLQNSLRATEVKKQILKIHQQVCNSGTQPVKSFFFQCKRWKNFMLKLVGYLRFQFN